MKINNGKLYINRTYKYLFPTLNFYGKEFKIKLNSLIKLAIGISDKNYNCKGKKCIFILLQGKNPLNKKYTETLQEFLSWIKTQNYYIDDYIFNNVLSSKHMLVLKIPTPFNEAYDNFLLGRYSKMYKKSIIDLYFKDTSKESKKDIRSILNKDNKYLQTFVNIINKEFNTNIKKEKLSHIELDYPINFKKETEIFNLKK